MWRKLKSHSVSLSSAFLFTVSKYLALVSNRGSRHCQSTRNSDRGRWQHWGAWYAGRKVQRHKPALSEQRRKPGLIRGKRIGCMWLFLFIIDPDLLIQAELKRRPKISSVLSTLVQYEPVVPNPKKGKGKGKKSKVYSC